MNTRYQLVTCLALLSLCNAIEAQKKLDKRWQGLLTSGIDSNPDGVLDRAELIAFLRTEILKEPSNGAETGLRIEVSDSKKFEKALERTADAIVLACDSSRIAVASPNQLIDPEEVDPLLGKDLSDLFVKAATFQDLAKEYLPPPAPPVRPLDVRLSDWLSIRRSFLDKNDTSKPATITWNHFGGDDETLEPGNNKTNFLIDGAVVATWGLTDSTSLVAAAEAHTAAGVADGKDTVLGRLGLSGTLWAKEDPDGRTVGVDYDATFDFTTDHDFDAEVYGGTFQLSPEIPALWIGEDHPHTGYPRFLWRPYFGLTYGDVADDGGSAALKAKDDFLDATARFGVALRLMPRVVLNHEQTFTKELHNGRDDHVWHSTGLIFSLVSGDKAEITLEVGYVGGEESPTFEEEDRTQVSLGIKL